MQIGFDFGGSLIKLSISHPNHESIDNLLPLIQHRITHKFNYHHRQYINILFRRDEFNDFITFLQTIHTRINQKFVVCTGGGVCDKRVQLQEALSHIELEPLSEFKSIIDGVEHFANIIPGFIYTLDDNMNKVVLDFKSLHPFLLANIGTGISINKVNNDGSSYLCGSSMGGTSLLGFSRLFNKNLDFKGLLNSFDEKIFNNDENWVFQRIYENLMEDKLAPDPVPYIFQGIINNISKIGYLLAKQHGIKHIMFIGNFMKDNWLARRQVQLELTNLSSKHAFVAYV